MSVELATWAAAIVPILYMFFGSVFALYIKDKLKDIHMTMLQQEIRLKEHQSKVRDELQSNQSEIRETIVKHIAEDAIQFRYIRENSEDAKHSLSEIKDSLKDKKC